VGTVDRFPIMNAEPPNLIDNSERLRRQVERFIQSLMKAGGGEFDLSQLPDDPVLLAYTAATLLQIPSVEKQVLLESEHSDVLLERLSVVYKREIALLQAVLEERGRAQGSFSVN
jgi:hypothetical protein